MRNTGRKIKYLTWIMICILIVVCMVGCRKNDSDRKEKPTILDADKMAVIHAGDVNVFLDEARYYAYTAQATYEAYYISEGKNIVWDNDMTEGVTWQQGVKSTVLDDICRRECMYALADSYNVSLTEEEKEQIDIAVRKYFSDTNKKLLLKVGIEEKRLKFVFQKAKIAEKVEEIMSAANKKNPDKVYESWKTGNTVTAEKQWQTINFNEHIFTLEDLE